MDDSELAALFARLEQGDATAMDDLLPIVYDELHRIAVRKMATERVGHTLQPTALVNEAWLRLGGDQQPLWKNRGHFFSAAAEAMRRILIDQARRKQADRRGGGLEHVRFDRTGVDLADVDESDEELLLLNDALEELAAVDPRRAELVKQRYFVGLTYDEVADLSGLSLRTVKRDWEYARAWLHDRIDRLRRGQA
ncbi:sigma-70 family RNA polymerase sigma factor [Actomonas aquatica]|uniref:Sigma-70 family RNA polymerase sigma factor n=1 Tax=Actomonas aquatica TaxID=2866162 RepID=A0ABZ1C3P4_9BACT|nr:sigma-70 family RNA polymerase sigma factor [Opitutus sp. WL0086]WRQ85985.1 sigma-70 family RNA polymerase sigma factor [Opitutus sp. WL0086]